ncbi:hypothetical protein [Streptomyces sp. NPDC008092]
MLGTATTTGGGRLIATGVGVPSAGAFAAALLGTSRAAQRRGLDST